MTSFTAIDFETAQSARNSICQVGLVRVENQKIIKSISLLIQPPENLYWQKFTDIHGINAHTTINSPTFDKIWSLIIPYIENQLVIAHNGFSFDFPVLANTLSHYGIAIPEYEKQCTYKLYKTNLASLCQQHHIELNHHDALSDARACAALYLKWLAK